VCAGAAPRSIFAGVETPVASEIQRNAFAASITITVRDVESVEALRDRLIDARRVLLVGNGGIAMELADALCRPGGASASTKGKQNENDHRTRREKKIPPGTGLGGSALYHRRRVLRSRRRGVPERGGRARGAHERRRGGGAGRKNFRSETKTAARGLDEKRKRDETKTRTRRSRRQKLRFFEPSRKRRRAGLDRARETLRLWVWVRFR
jgi:hypothetical protein